jgi:hypothetical protein
MQSNAERPNVTLWFWIAVAASAAMTALIAGLGPLLASVPHLPDKGSAWYYWQLPARTLGGRLSAWGLYGLHQASVWVLVALAMREGRHPKSMSRINFLFLGVNILFSALHVLQTHLWYDGLAQDVPIWTSQFSVIVMLVLILFLLIPRRGIILGKKVALPAAALGFVKRWHGLYISWALVYTFWFHPTEGALGIVAGFFYMFLLFSQMSLANTRAHYVIGWITVLELLVGLHGPLVAVLTANGMWPMFLFGFLFLFVFTQQFGFRLHPAVRALIFAAYAAAVLFVYITGPGIAKVYQILFIPSALYGGAFALVGLSWIFGRGKAGAGERAAPGAAG